MAWLFLIVAWFLQLHFLTALPWLNVVWPLFALIVILISPKLDKYKLSWVLLFLGILADLSSHLAPGIILKGYLFLVVVIWVLPILLKHLKKVKFGNIIKFATVVLIMDMFYVTQFTSWNSLFLSLKYELFVVTAMAFTVVGFVVVLKYILRGGYEKTK